MRPRWAVILAAVAALLAGCTTVPSSSPAQVVQSVPIAGAAPQDVTIPRDEAPRDIVSDFISYSALGDPNHNTAREFLTREERSRWVDNTTTTIIDDAIVGNLDAGKIIVTGREIGQIDGSTGVYTPALRGDGTGTGGPPVSETYQLSHAHGEWRIAGVQPGLLIDQAHFQQSYRQRALYFLDGAQQHLVPDPRYSALTSPQDLMAWLIAGLAQGPRGNSLQTALPNQADPKRVQVEFPATASGPTKVEIARAAQLGATDRQRLAAQVAATLGQVDEDVEIEITDNGKPVRIPEAGTTFTPQEMSTQFVVSPPASALYYIYQGAVFSRGQRISGKVGAGAYNLTSVAVATSTIAGELNIAGVWGTGKEQTLDIGTTAQLYRTTVHGQLSRPAWAPDADEAWIGDGADLYRVTQSGAVRQIPVDAAAGKASGRIVAVRLSPEGSRVALVLRASDGTSQVYLGSVVRSGSSVRVASLTPISPQGVSVADVAWNDELKLFAIGIDSSTNTWGLYEVQCDGSLWTLRSNSGLPQPPDTLTVTAGAVAVVSAGSTVWQQSGGSWRGLLRDDTHGTSPIYLE